MTSGFRFAYSVRTTVTPVMSWVSQTLFHSLVRSRTTRRPLSFIWAAVT